MSGSIKTILIVLGLLAAILLVSQFVMGILIIRGAEQKIRTMHQHSGYLTAAVSLLYILFSLGKIASAPTTTPSA